MTTSTPHRRMNLKLWYAAGVAAVAIAAPLIVNRYVAIDPRLVARFGYPAVFAICALGSLTLLLPVPGLAIVFAVSGVLNPVLVALAAGAGMAVGMLPSYYAGARGGGALLERFRIGQSDRATAILKVVAWGAKRVGATASFLLALVPNPLFDFAGILAGSLNVPLWRFAVGTFGGKVLQAAIVAFAGKFAFAGLPG